MWTMAALMSAQLELLRDNLYQATKDTIETLESKDKDMGPVDIAQVQAWLLLAMYEFMQTYHRRGWMSAGRAFRLMQLLRLDEIDNVNSAAGWYDPKAQDDWIAKEEKRRTFWMAYCLDRVISIHSSMPLTLSEHVISTRLPASEAEFQSGQPVLVSFLPEVIGTTEQKILSPFTECIIFATLYGRSLYHGQQSTVERIYRNAFDDFWDRHKWLDSILTKRMQILSRTCPFATEHTDPMLLFTRMLAQTTVLHLNMIIQSTVWETDEYRDIVFQYGKRSMSAAQEMVSLAKASMLNIFKASSLIRNASVVFRRSSSKGPPVCADNSIFIGCDGIKSRVREILLGVGNPASYPSYTYKVAYRALIPMDKAVTVYKARNQHMHVGPGAHILHFPVAGQTLMNVVAFATDPNEWPDDEKMTAPATRPEVEAAFAEWGPTIRALTNLFPDELDKWAVFDSFDHPAPTYARGRMCIAGDAAHASAPHHGAGAGIGVEDALCLVTLLEAAISAMQSKRATEHQALSMAFNTFNAVRHERSQWLVNSSRDICDVYEWADAKTGKDREKCFQEVEWRSHKIWYFDFEGMLRDAADGYERRLKACEEGQGNVENHAFHRSEVVKYVESWWDRPKFRLK